MANLTSRMGYRLPTEDADPWYAAFEALFGQVDAATYASREDRNLILMGGGSISWDVGTSTLAWTEPLRVMSPITGLLCIVEAGSAVLPNDGQLLVAPVVRYPTGSNKTVVATVQGQIPSILPNDQYLFCIRYGDLIYWRNGLVQADGSTLANFQPAAGFTAGGDLDGSSSDQEVIRLRQRPIDAVAPAVGQVYKWDGAKWTPSADAAGTMPTLVFRPGGVASGNVYVTWTNLMSTFNTIEGPVWIELDGSLSTPVIPSGTHDMEGRAHFVGRQTIARVSVQLDSGAYLKGPASFQHLSVYALASSTGYIGWDVGATFYMFDCQATTYSDVQVLFRPYVGNTWYVRDCTFTSQGTGFPVIEPLQPVNGGQQYIYLEGFSTIPDNVFAGTRTINVWLQTGWTTCGSAHPAHTGTLNIYAMTAGAPQTTFVFRPGGVASGNVYTSWTLLMADLSTVAGPKIIEFDSSSDPNVRCDIPTGVHALGYDTILRGRWGETGSASVKILMADGAQFVDASVLEGGLQVWSASTDAIFTWTGLKHLVLREAVQFFGATYPAQAAPTSPLISGYEITIEMRDDCFFGASSGDQPILHTDIESTNTLQLYDHAWIGVAGGGAGVGENFSFGTDAFLYVNIYDQAVYFSDAGGSNTIFNLHCIRRHVVDLTKSVISNPAVIPAACGTGYISFDSLPKHLNLTCKYRVIIETTSGTPGFEAYIDLYDVHGQFNGGVPRVVPGSQTDTGSGSAPTGAPTPNSLVPSLYEVDLTSAIIGGAWVSDIAIFESRVWIGMAGGGNAAICKSAELIFEW